VNSGFTVTNIDGTWVCVTGTGGGTVIFNVSNQPVGTTPQTISTGTVSGGALTEPGGGSYTRTNAYTNDDTNWTASVAGSLTNIHDIIFPTSTDVWGTALSLFASESGTTAGGSILWYFTLNPSINILSDTTLIFLAYAVNIALSV
jgi:hypothetical protein